MQLSSSTATRACAIALHVAGSPPMHWEPLHSGVTVRLRGVRAVSARVAWASGERGTVLRTTDGRPGFAAGAHGRIARLSVGGRSK